MRVWHARVIAIDLIARRQMGDVVAAQAECVEVSSGIFGSGEGGCFAGILVFVSESLAESLAQN